MLEARRLFALLQTVLGTVKGANMKADALEMAHNASGGTENIFKVSCSDKGNLFFPHGFLNDIYFGFILLLETSNSDALTAASAEMSMAAIRSK